MKYIIFLGFFLTITFAGVAVHAQQKQKTEATSEKQGDGAKRIFTTVDEMPQAKYDMNAYLAENLQYPETARKQKIEGKVYIKFVVDKKGRVKDVKVSRGIGGGCDEEAVRVISSFPRWKAGKQNGKKVSVYCTLPIVFKLS